MPKWEVQLLGGLRIQSADRLVTRFRTRSVDGVFAYLALNLGQDIRREKLIDLGWPGSEPLQGQQNLRTALTSIRTTLGAEVLDADRSVVRLKPEFFDVDAVAFREKRDPSLYRGRLLEGLDCAWVLPAALELEEAYVLAILKQIETMPAAGALKVGAEALRRVPSSVTLRSKMRELDDPGNREARGAPYIVSSFIGREVELRDLAQLLEGNRLITLTGFGGSGKTRLAAELWNRNRPDAWFISLSDLSDASFIGEALRQGLRLPPTSKLSAMEQVLGVLRHERGLLILDNFEHLLPGVNIVEELLTGCPELRIVTTSRVGLGLEGEVEYRVGTLRLESKEGLSESAQLFEARAKAVMPDFAVSAQNADAVADLCSRLDGFPLALEFAAARSRIFSPGEMLRQLDDRFEFLAHTGHGQGRRKTSLLDALDWSFDRLSEADQLLLCRLSVFDGGFTLEAAERVCGATHSGTQIETLSTAAWVERVSGSGPTRFRLLESVRDYGSALLAPRDRVELARAHAEHYLALAKRCFDASFSPDEPRLHRLVADDIHNIDAAWLWLRDHDPEGALSIVGGLNWYWILSGLAHIGEARMKDALSRADTTPRHNLGRSYHHCGNFILFQGRFAEAEYWLRKAYEVDLIVGNPLSLGLSACQLGRVLCEMGRSEESECYVDLAIEQLLEVGDDNWLCAGFTIRALAANRAGDAHRAIEAGLAAVDHGRRGGYRWGIASSLNELAMGYHLAGEFDLSLAHQSESIAIKRDQNALPSLALSLADQSATLLKSGNVEEAVASMRECARILLNLSDFETMPRLFATASELLWLRGNFKMASCSLSKMVNLSRDRAWSASEKESHDQALFPLRELSGEASAVATRAIVEALATM